MRRVLLTVHKFFPQHRAGTEVLTLKVAQDLQRRGYEVLVVTANPPDLDARHPSPTATSDYVYEGVPVHVIEESLRLDGYTFTHEYVHEGIAKHFAGILKSFAPDLVHSFHCQNVSASIIDVSLEAKIPVVFSATDFWFVCPVVQLKRPDGALCRGPSQFATNCLTCYTPQLFPPAAQVKEAIEKKYASIGRLLSQLPAPIAGATTEILKTAYVASKLPSAVKATVKRPQTLRQRLNRVEKVMVATKLMQDIFIENGIRPEIIQHVPFGLDTEPLLAFQKKTAATQLRIGFIGTIFEHKGLDLLVKAFQSLPDHPPAMLRIYGDMNQFPDYAEGIRKLVQAHPAKADKIEFAGTFPNSELGSVLQNLDVLVVPSRWYENTPLVIQSALTTKTPVVATNLGGMSELIRHEFNGLLFALNDDQSLANQLLRLLNERGLLERLISNIPPERTITQMVDDIEVVYDSIGIENWHHKHNSSKHELAAN
jgi:glycosyltransferase involved in cell wall biosynthesis